MNFTADSSVYDLCNEIEQAWYEDTALKSNTPFFLREGLNGKLSGLKLAELMRYELPAVPMYNALYELFRSAENPESFGASAPEMYHLMMQQMLNMMLPETLPEYFKKPADIAALCLVYYENTLHDSVDVPEILIENGKNSDATKERYLLFKAINEKLNAQDSDDNCDISFGLRRDGDKEIRDASSSLISFLFTFCELYYYLKSVSEQIGTELLDTLEAKEAESDSFSFDDFYKLWSQTTQDMLISSFFEDEYSNIFSRFLSSSMKYSANSKKVYERSMESHPIVKESEIRHLYRTVYELRKELRDLHDKIDRLEAKGE